MSIWNRIRGKKEKFVIPTYSPQAIYFEVDGKLHRGWRDGSGRFTLEQCNLDAAFTARHVGDVTAEEATAIENRCQNCFPA